MKRRALGLILALLLPLLLFSSCSAPRTEEIYDRVVYLLDGVREIDGVFFGDGLPVYEPDSEFAKETHLYDDFEETDEYLYVSSDSPYVSIDRMKAVAETYYAADYLEKSVYPQLFDGIVVDTGSATVFCRPRFYDNGEWLLQSTDAENYLASGIRHFDFSTLKVVNPSNQNACFVQITSWFDNPTETESFRVKLVKQNGDWFLAGPTF